jgi:hypothetical protein
VNFEYFTLTNNITSGIQTETFINGWPTPKINTKSYKPKYISKITTKNYTLQFNRNEDFTRQDILNESCLTSIVIRSNARPSLEKRFKFKYHNMISPTPAANTYANTFATQDECNKRMVLDAFMEINGSDTCKYKFTYNSGILPAKNSYARDYWGYNNGQTSNQSLLPDKDK